MSKGYTGSQLFRRDLRKALVKEFPNYKLRIREGTSHAQTVVSAWHKSDGSHVTGEEADKFTQKVNEIGAKIPRLVDLVTDGVRWKNAGR